MPTIVSVNVGTPQLLRRLNTKNIYSSINKQRVTKSSMLLTYTNLQGDQQVDTKPKEDGSQLHGGNEKAVYVYPEEHYSSWRAELGQYLPIPSFGENLTLRGIQEEEVRIGDRWQWGDALLEVSKPRQPCYKLAWHLKVRGIEEQMWQNGRCGWYMRVLEPGIVPTSGAIAIVHRGSGSCLTIAEAFGQKRVKNSR